MKTKIVLIIFIFALLLNIQFYISTRGNIFNPSNLLAVEPEQKYEMHIIFCSCGNGHYSYGFNCKFEGPPYECSYHDDYCFCD